MVITWLAITALALVYTVAIIVLTPSEEQNSVSYVIGYTVVVWLLLMGLLLLGHTIRLFLRMVKKLRKAMRRRRTVLAAGSRAVVVNNVDGV